MKPIFQIMAVFLASGLSIAATAAPAPAEPKHFSAETGYRMSRYRAPTPDTVDGGTRIDIDELDALVRDEGALLLDVMVAQGAGPDPKTGVWRLSKPRKTLPGAVWLANVGKGKLSSEISAYLQANLAALTNNDKSRPIIIFCMADCWMSWNAVIRIARLGYTRVYWYAEGTDGWRDWSRPFVTAVPRPLQRAQFADADGATSTANDAAPAALPRGEKTVTLVSQDGSRLDIAKATFTSGPKPGRITFTLTLLDGPFQDEFLSMRPFRCLPDKKEMWCHLAYPYENKKEISAADLQDLEYALLFLFKPPAGYGIDAWNGLYFKMVLGADGSLTGTLHETDMNVLAVPPADGELRPISHGALSQVDADTHRFHKIEIR